MKVETGRALVTVLLGIGLFLPKAAKGAEGRIDLVWLDSHRLYAHSEIALREVDAIFKTLGIDVHWRPADAETTFDPSSSEIRVVLMPSEPSGWGMGHDVMGVVVREDTSRQQALYVFFPSVLRGLGLARKGNRVLKPRQRKDLGRALGRVIAHEVIHAVAPSLSHTSHGLMNRRVKRAHLLRKRLELDAESRQVVRAALLTSRAAPREAAGPANASPTVYPTEGRTPSRLPAHCAPP